MRTKMRKVSLSPDEDLIAALEASPESLSAEVNEASGAEVRRRTQRQALTALLARFDAESGALDQPDDEAGILRFVQLFGGPA